MHGPMNVKYREFTSYFPFKLHSYLPLAVEKWSFKKLLAK